MRVTGLHRYPVKSMRGQSLPDVVLEPWGLAGDRRWMLIDAAGDCVTAREYPQLLLFRPELADDGVRITAPDGSQAHVRTPEGAPTLVSIHGKDPYEARAAGEAANHWLSHRLGLDVRLVWCDEPRRRALNPRFSRETDSAAFADAYPVLLTTEASLERLNEWIAAGRFPEQGPLPMNRFRPNIVVDGDLPFGEDSWRRIRIGGASFRAPKGCDRCVMTTRDAETAVGGKEPIASLAHHRKYDGATWFGMNLIPDTADDRISVGDEVEVLETAISDGPPR